MLHWASEVEESDTNIQGIQIDRIVTKLAMAPGFFVFLPLTICRSDAGDRHFVRRVAPMADVFKSWLLRDHSRTLTSGLYDIPTIGWKFNGFKLAAQAIQSSSIVLHL
ncbi:hypothetical protein TB2_006320 [Malus domestica]